MIQPRHPLTDAERLDWIRLIRTENVGPITFHRLMEQYGSAAKALDMLPELARRGGRSKPLRVAPKAEAEREVQANRRFGARLICACEPDYPEPLAAVDDAPPVISVAGHAHLLRRRAVAIVGARNASLNGKKFAESLARDLGEAGLLVVSGLARGIDTAAHAGSIASGTAAVLAGGIDVVYPPENEGLYRDIMALGVVVAESPIGTQPQARHFPRRNRLISGLSLGVLVVEAALRSGSLITARMALEQGREVMAVPGSPLDPRCQVPTTCCARAPRWWNAPTTCCAPSRTCGLRRWRNGSATCSAPPSMPLPLQPSRTNPTSPRHAPWCWKTWATRPSPLTNSSAGANCPLRWC